MDMTGEVRIPAPRAKVWSALNDPEILKQCIPGCEEIDKSSDTEMTAKVRAKVGPVSARFSGKVLLSDLDPPNGYKISGEGTGGPAGFAKGGATVHLADDGAAATVLSYTVDANVGGKLAQIGSRLIDATARKMAGDFFTKFSEIVGAAAPVAPPETPAEPAPSQPPPPPEVPQQPTPPPPPPPEAAGAAPAPVAPEPVRYAATAEPPRKRLSPFVWVVLLAAAVAILLYLFTGMRGG